MTTFLYAVAGSVPKFSPGIGDQINPFGLRGREGTRDYRRWFEIRFPNTVNGATELLREIIQKKICRNCCGKPNTVDGLTNPQEDVDIKPDMRRFGDEEQTFWERRVQIGYFEFKADDISIYWQEECGGFRYAARIYVIEHTGADFPFSKNSTNMLCDMLWFTGMFVSRDVTMAEWYIYGIGECDGVAK